MEVQIVQAGDANIMRGGGSVIGQRGRGGERKQAPLFSPRMKVIGQQSLRGKNPSLRVEQKLPKKRFRNGNWTEDETTNFIECISRYCKGKIKIWGAIVEEMKKLVPGFTRSKEECQRRLDTLKKALKKVKRLWGVNYKQLFQTQEEERRGQLSTLLKVEWYEALQQIEQQEQKKPSRLSSSNFGGSPFLSGAQTPSRSDLAEDAGSSGTDMISSPENSASADPTLLQDSSAVPYQTYCSSESMELPLQQVPESPATPNNTGVALVPHRWQVIHPNLPDGEVSGVLWDLDHAPSVCDLKSIDKDFQEYQDCFHFSAQYSEYSLEDIPQKFDPCGDWSLHQWDL